MADMCLCALVVEGSPVEVREFVKVAQPLRRLSQPEDSYDCSLLSFRRLDPRPDEEDLTDIYGTPSPEPEDCTRTRLKRVGATRARVEYRFLTKWSEPYVLFRRVSKQFPRLEFLLGAVAPAVDETNCWYFHQGRGRNWKMPDHRREGIRTEAYRAEGLDIEEDDDLGIDVEADHTMMTEALAHWTPARRRAARPSRKRAN